MTLTTQLTPFRYETPTVTLEVTAREAAVSQWSAMPVVQVLRFQLQVRNLDPEVPPVEIRGDRTDFIPLNDAVQHYIQTQLTRNAPEARDRRPDAPYLEAQGLTCHVLHLGSLSAPEQVSTLTLGAIQLADLGDVFDQLEAQVQLLPVALTPLARRRPWRQWGTVAAGVVAAVGLTTALWPTYQSYRGGNETALEAPIADQELPPPPASSRLEQAPVAEESLPAEDAPAATAPETAPPPDEALSASPPQATVDATPKTQSSNPSPPPANDEAAVPPKPSAAPPTPAEVAPAVPPTPSQLPAAPAPEPEALAGADDNVETESFGGVEAEVEGDEGMSPESMPEGMTAADDVPENDAPNASIFSDIGRTATSTAAAAAAPPPLATLTAAIAERWQPPEALEQTLSYTLTLTAAGALAEITPDTDLAASYRDRAGLPEIGTQISAPGEFQQIQVLLFPNGEVQVTPID
ncbi:MAG: DUF4335 domain-containing protein [Leptolyngbya sp. SIO1E4]|nr:DUF4335 domain-containing protein [Leptolyngbya sp. SIO1E4]